MQFKGLSRVFCNTAVQKHQFFGTEPSSQSNSHIHTLIGKDLDAGKDLRQEEKVSAEDEIVGWHYQLDGHELVTEQQLEWFSVYMRCLKYLLDDKYTNC